MDLEFCERVAQAALAPDYAGFFAQHRRRASRKTRGNFGGAKRAPSGKEPSPAQKRARAEAAQRGAEIAEIARSISDANPGLTWREAWGAAAKEWAAYARR